jgi:hypothetical protein
VSTKKDLREIEIKLSVGPLDLDKLVFGFESLGLQMIRDEYYDSSSFWLTKKDVWLRKRTDSDGVRFEMKMGSAYNKTSSDVTDHEEVLDPNRIAKFLGIPVSRLSDDGLRENGYVSFCSCLTSRSRWKNGVFTIDIDEAVFEGYPNFSFPVVEIEVESDDPKIAGKLVKDLLFERGVNFKLLSLGKIHEFLRLHRPEHFRVLLEVGVVKTGDSQLDDLFILMRKEQEELGFHGNFI